jgi:hypothetical protein
MGKIFLRLSPKSGQKKKKHTCTQYGIADLQIKNKRDVSPIYMLHSFILFSGIAGVLKLREI